jgi:DNA-binding winged helix-turn-helix (wHTH) protein
MRIDLASEPDFSIGPLTARPETREIEGPAGRDTLEPRVMMLLVALARAQGHTVSRDRLVHSCWDGLVVSDDAIQRAVAKLRRIATETGAFSIETIPRVGYRLRTDAHVPAAQPEQPAADLPAPAAPANPAARTYAMRILVAGAALGGAALLGAVVLQQRSIPIPAVAAAVPDPAAAALLERGRAAISEHSPSRVMQGVAQLQEATVRAPDSAVAWGSLALGYSTLLFRTPPDEQPALVRRAEGAIARALALDPAQPEAMMARAGLGTPYGRWLAQERLEREAHVAGQGRQGKYARFLQFVGRNAEALPIIERATKANPMALYAQVGRASALFATGRIDEADRATADLVRLWPQNYLAWFNRVYFLMYSGRAREAVVFLDNRDAWPLDIPQAEIVFARQMADAVATADPAKADAVIARYDELVTQGQGYMENAIRVSAALGRPDDAFRFARFLYLSPMDRLPRQRFANQRNFAVGDDRHTDLLFRPPMDRLHADPRFMALVTEMGLVDYWKRSGTVPDFCRRLVEPCRRAGLAVKG